MKRRLHGKAIGAIALACVLAISGMSTLAFAAEENAESGAEIVTQGENDDNRFSAWATDSSIQEPACTYYVEPGNSVDLRVSVEADDKSHITYEWSGPEGVLSCEESIYTLMPDSAAKYVCTVSDGYGHSTAVYFEICIKNGFDAWITGSEDHAASSSAYLDENGTAVLDVTVEANDQSKITYEWLGPDGSRIDGANEATYIVTSGEKGRYECHVSDGYGNHQYIYFQVSNDNGFRAWAADDEYESNYLNVYAEKGQPVDLRVSYEANDDSNITFTWFDTQGQEIADVNGPFYTAPADVVGNYSCSIEDGYGNSEYINFWVTIENNLCAWATDSENQEPWYNLTAEKGQTITLKVTAEATDMEGVSYQWNDEYGRYLSGANGATCDVEVNEPGKYTCYVHDQYGNSSSVEFNISIENGLRAWAADSEVEEPYYEYHINPEDSVELNVLADADDKSNITYTWHKPNGDIDDTNTSTYTVVSSDAGTYECCVEDGYGNSVFVRFYIAVENGFHAWVTDEGRYTTDSYIRAARDEKTELKVSVEANDQENITYTWTDSDGNELLSGKQASYSVPENETGEYQCFVTDGYGNYEYIHFWVSLDNQFHAYVSGDENKSNSTLVYIEEGKPSKLKVSADAADKSKVTYTWYEQVIEEDGSSYFNPLQESGDTLTVNDKEKKAYYCTVSDGYGNSC